MKRSATMLISNRRSPPKNFGQRTPAIFYSSDFNINNRSIISDGVHSIMSRGTRPTLLPPFPDSDEFGHNEQAATIFSNGERDYASYHSKEVEEDDVEEIPNNGKTNLKWNAKIDDLSIDALLGQMLKGKNIGTSFTSTAYKVVTRTVSMKFKVNCLSSHVLNRLKTIKQNYAIIPDMIASTRGFCYNHSSQMMENEDTVWDEYIKARPKAAKYRHMPIRNYGKLLDLFWKDRATRSHAAGPKQRRSRSHKDQVNQNIENVDDSTSFEFELGTNSTCHGKTPTESEAEGEHNGNINDASKHSSESKKRKSRISDILREEFISIKGGLDNVAASFDRGNVRNYDDDKLYNEIEKVDDLSEIVVMKIYQALSVDVIRARAFLSCRKDRHKLWLLVRFGRSFLEDENVVEAFDLNNVGSSA